MASCELIAVSAVYLHSGQNAFPMSVPPAGQQASQAGNEVQIMAIAHSPLRNCQTSLDK